MTNLKKIIVIAGSDPQSRNLFISL